MGNPHPFYFLVSGYIGEIANVKKRHFLNNQIHDTSCRILIDYHSIIMKEFL
ncbi:hypothetical protein AS54_1219 [Bacillus cereus 03BB102]|uniref:Uncharacterized protein n=1 Tax=Bacillus cereus 03BB108 TaxID=451709 RepID=A0AAN0SVP8_BACCE|nr:hypothetical protein AS54_1219 [Bacillus cereus 03BB102]AJG58587.1 hypothetical protein AW22_3535 [Bacillus cereus D17]AJH67431.1 hypothetical protein BF32_4263 [Bacillus thuringiensis]AJI10927.1 hypothetical protein AK40_5305 [Bacillus cereus 03BB108]EJQ91854.1 hypothetical protein IGW_03661 [Bacillus cereus ISP3191]SMD90220.1 hypothetical protein BACERE00175_02143 [Bacillus cereus]